LFSSLGTKGERRWKGVINVMSWPVGIRETRER